MASFLQTSPQRWKSFARYFILFYLSWTWMVRQKVEHEASKNSVFVGTGRDLALFHIALSIKLYRQGTNVQVHELKTVGSVHRFDSRLAVQVWQTTIRALAPCHCIPSHVLYTCDPLLWTESRAFMIRFCILLPDVRKSTVACLG